MSLLRQPSAETGVSPWFVHVRDGECTNTNIHRHTQPGPKGSSFESVSPGRLGWGWCV